jgi:hypothetical protein
MRSIDVDSMSINIVISVACYVAFACALRVLKRKIRSFRCLGSGQCLPVATPCKTGIQVRVDVL